MKRIRRILVANRGEIAVRIVRACREMGIEAVAVHSRDDVRSPHVQIAHESYPLGGAPGSVSYLDIDEIVSLARHSRCDAVHPGYGFLAENADFAEAVERSGIVFVGPPVKVLRDMGDKTRARRMVRETGVPVIAGVDHAVDMVSDFRKAARKVGFPVLIKAAAGGGGKGMRIVRSEDELPEAITGARSEASSAFGDGRIYVEKYLESPCHIEVQVLADSHGNVIHLGERECSIQRRHQKIIEETPSVHLSPPLRKSITEAALAVANKCRYVNAGTVEFLYDRKSEFYFLEMNTRLQVEHPVTEAVTGIDLVKEQIRIAEGERLSVTQEQVQSRGHAIECRIYAEDPFNSFFPSTGTITRYRSALGPGIREDCGVEEGTEITIHYDPLLAKLIALSASREDAIARMRRALEEIQVGGIETTIPFCIYVMGHPDFRGGKYDTSFVESKFAVDAKRLGREMSVVAGIAASCVARWRKSRRAVNRGRAGGRAPKGPSARSDWRSRRMETGDWLE